jgi:hypothetical protein
MTSTETTRPLRRRFSIAAGALLACLATGTAQLTFEAVAYADGPAASDLESARELLQAGRALRDKGDLAGALEKFKASHALAHTPITGIELARTHAALNQPVEAREVCLSIARSPVAREETSRSHDAREEAAKLAETMKAKIGTLAVDVVVPSGRTAIVKIDGVEVPQVALTEGRKVDPGAHVVTARIDDGPEVSTKAELREGETKRVSLSPQAPAVVVKPTERPIAPPPQEVDEKRMSPLVPIGFTVAAVGVGVGAVTGLVAQSKSSNLDLTCPANQCRGTAASNLATAKSLATVSTVGFVVGGVGAVVGVIGILSPKVVRVKRGNLEVSPYVTGTTGAEVGLHGSF